MAETSKNKIYYNDNENNAADVLADMKKLAQSTDDAIEKSKYNDTQIKKDISNMKTEITAKDNAQDNKILKLQTEKAELEKELKEAQEDFYQNSIRGQASGECIHVEDSSNCRARIGIGGNQEQETRAGYNKLNMSNAKGGTSGGITCVINEDGSYQFKGTATTTDNGTVNVWFLGYYNSEAPTLFTLEAGTYYINDVVLFSGIKQLNKTLTKIYTFTSEVNITGVRAMSATPGQTYNEVKYPIIAKSNKELTWEQYGVSPSLGYQSPVKTVGSNVNYYNKETEKIGFVLSDGSLQPNNTVWTHSNFIEVNSNEVISITCENKANGQFAIVEYDKNKKFLKHNMVNYVNTETNNKFTIITTSTTKYVIGAYRNDSNMNNIMIVKDSKVLPYNPNCNGMGAVKVTKCNKNISKLLGKDSYWQYTSRGIKNMGRNNGTRILEFELKKGQKVTIGLKLFSKPIKSTTFTIYLNGETNSQFLNINEYALNQIYKKEYTVTEDSLIEIRNWGNENSETYEFQLWAEIGSLTDYIQHEEQSYIMPVQQEMLQGDYFDFDNEEEVHIFGKKVLTGNENWSRGTTRKGFYYFDYSDNNFVGSYNAKSDIFCNIAEKISASDLYEITSQKYLIAVYTKTLRLSLNNISTVDELKSYLKAQYDAGIPVVVYYKLATPTRLKFTEEQKAVAKELNNARTYKNVTNITTDSIAILDLDYAKDLEGLTKYSTEEQRAGTWIDGKKLYRKVISLTAPICEKDGTYVNQGCSISNNIDFAVIELAFIKDEYNQIQTFPYITNSGYCIKAFIDLNKNINLTHNIKSYSSKTVSISVLYTKTTD